MQYKILMVDDDRELLKMLNQYFTLKNYTVMIAQTGAPGCGNYTDGKSRRKCFRSHARCFGTI